MLVCVCVCMNLNMSGIAVHIFGSISLAQAWAYGNDWPCVRVCGESCSQACRAPSLLT